MEQLAEVVVVLQDCWEVVVLSAYLVGLTVLEVDLVVLAVDLVGLADL